MSEIELKTIKYAKVSFIIIFEILVNKSFYSFFFLDSKAKNLENKLNALNDISDIINNLKIDNIKHKLFHEFITQNKILKIIFLD